MSNMNPDSADDPAGEQKAREAVMAQEMTPDTSGSEQESRRPTNEIDAANDRALRAQAELENFRKRMRREVDEERRHAALPLISELLPVIDNLDRAITTGEQSNASEELLQGVRMVRTQFLSVLERHYCRRVGEVGETFDPHRHQAIAQEPSDQYPAGVVTRVARSGYQLHERVIRPAEVLVSSRLPGQTT